jgi:hypothetical protein
MRPTLLALVLGMALAAEAFAGDAVTVLQERRTRVPGKKPAVEHVALMKNTSAHSIRGLRVTVELHDSFGKLLWTRTVTPGPSSLKPGDTGLAVGVHARSADYKKTVYRFDYRPDGQGCRVIVSPAPLDSVSVFP